MPILVPRTVTGTCEDANGNAYASRQIYFSPVAVFGADGVVVSPEAITATTDEEGAFTVDLYTIDQEDVFVRYVCILPDGTTVRVDLEAGDDVTLDALISLGFLGDADLAAVLAAMQTLIDTHAAVKASLSVLGHVRIDGTTIAINGSGVISTVAHVVGETPSGLVNGVNATYTTAFNFTPASIAVFLNGVMQKKTVDFNTSGVNTLILAVSPTTGETVLVNYQKA